VNIEIFLEISFLIPLSILFIFIFFILTIKKEPSISINEKFLYIKELSNEEFLNIQAGKYYLTNYGIVFLESANKITSKFHQGSSLLPLHDFRLPNYALKKVHYINEDYPSDKLLGNKVSIFECDINIYDELSRIQSNPLVINYFEKLPKDFLVPFSSIAIVDELHQLLLTLYKDYPIEITNGINRNDIYNLLSQNSVRDIKLLIKNNYVIKSKAKSDTFKHNSYLNPLFFKSSHYFVYFHKVNNIYYELYKLFAENFAFKIIQLSNFEGDDISENYVAIFKEKPDYSFYGKRVRMLKKDLHFDLFNQYYPKFITPSLDKYESFRSISGFAYKGKSLKNLLYSNSDTIDLVPNGLFPNDFLLNYKSGTYGIIKNLINLELGNVSFNKAIFYTLLDNYNPHFNKSIFSLDNGMFDTLMEVAKEKGILPTTWKSEYYLYLEIKKIYPDTIFQYRATWLIKQSIDIFIPSLNIGVEYQGKQHYVPVGLFGGEPSLKRNKARDKEKLEKAKKAKVKLLYWKYDEFISEANVKRFIKTFFSTNS
jgi:hypothetical protein